MENIVIKAGMDGIVAEVDELAAVLEGTTVMEPMELAKQVRPLICFVFCNHQFNRIF